MIVAEFGSASAAVFIVAMMVLGVIGTPILAVTIHRRDRRRQQADQLDQQRQVAEAAQAAALPKSGMRRDTDGASGIPFAPGTHGARVVERGRRGSGTWLQVKYGPPPGRTVPLEGIAARTRPNGKPGPDGPADGAALAGDNQQLPSEISATSDESSVEIRVMGTVEIAGITEDMGRRQVELAAFLALHEEREMTGEEIRAALWPDDVGSSAKNLRNAVSLLRNSLGKQSVPHARHGTGYCLVGILSDWSRFQELVARAQAHGPDEVDCLMAALKLIRGRPFEAVSPGSFEWAWSELHVSRMEVLVSQTAHRAINLCIASGDIDSARWSVMQGLVGCPFDRTLWSDRITVAKMGDEGELERVRRDARAVLGDEAENLGQDEVPLRSSDQ